jgi:hypothetical protein
VVAGNIPVLVHNCLTNKRSPEEQAIERDAAVKRGVSPTTIGEGEGLPALQRALGNGTDFKWAVVAKDGGNELRVIPAHAGGESGGWPRVEIAHTVLSAEGETVLSAGSGTVADDIFPTAINNWSGHYDTPDELLSIGEDAFNRAGIDHIATPFSVLKGLL